jgi:hypothetical protein
MRRDRPDTSDDRARAKRRAAAYASAMRTVAANHRDEFLAAYRTELQSRGLADHPHALEVSP